MSSKTVKELKLSNGDSVWFVTTWPAGDTEVIFKATAEMTDEDEIAIGAALRRIAEAAMVRRFQFVR